MCFAFTRISPSRTPHSSKNSLTCRVILTKARRVGTWNQSSLRKLFTSDLARAMDFRNYLQGWLDCSLSGLRKEQSKAPNTGNSAWLFPTPHFPPEQLRIFKNTFHPADW